MPEVANLKATITADTNDTLVSNLPHFVPPMLVGDPAVEYRCAYIGEQLIGVTRHALL